MNLFRLLNRLPRLKRWPLKCAILAAAVFLICFPRMTLFTRHVYRWRNPNTLIEPQAAALQPLLEELRLRMSPELSAVEALSTVEQFVYEKIAYKYDWINWGNTDYIPTVTEAVEAGQEDCDGRAVVAASLLRNFGFQADLVTDFTHVWVRTEHGDTMSPGDQTAIQALSLIHISEPTRRYAISYAVFCLKKKMGSMGRHRGDRGGVYGHIGPVAA